MRIDVHAHILSKSFLRELADQGLFGIEQDGDAFLFPGYGPLDHWLFDLESRLDSLRRRQLDLQLVGPPPRMVSHSSWATDTAFARRLNTQTAEIVARGEGLLGGLAAPALGEPGQAADELRRAKEEHGFLGVALPSAAADIPLDRPEFEPFFAACEDLELLVFMHPTTAADRSAWSDYTLLQLVGWPFETTLAVARLIFAGTFERHPGLKLVLAHGGGALPWLSGRLDLGYFAPEYEANPDCRANISKPPSAYLQDMYFDTVVADPGALEYLVSVVGPERVLFGSDYPFEIGDAEGAKSLPAIEAMDTKSKELILGGNAERLLSLRKR
jgi:aminocarboxymuconate-semialdehyde decarboxylase